MRRGKNMAKVGILTFHSALNFGAVLQAYALQKYLEKCGHDVDIINYIPERIKRAYTRNPFKAQSDPVNIVKYGIKSLLTAKQYRLFKGFRSNYLKLTKKIDSKDELFILSDKYDTIICGSDQIWDLSRTQNDDAYFLAKIQPKVRKVSYAASFGGGNITDVLVKYINEYLSDFYKVSVREDHGLAILNKTSRIQARKTIDPVFLLDREQWDEVSGKAKISDRKYILYYALEKNRDLKEAALNLASRENIPIYSIHPTGNKPEFKTKHLFNIGPIEFLSLVRNAEYICSNSFHCAAFGIIYGKKVVPALHSKTGQRMKSLLKMVNIVELNDVIDMRAVNYDLIFRMKNESADYLYNSLKQ